MADVAHAETKLTLRNVYRALQRLLQPGQRQSEM
jgi:hypothetical protein